MSEINNLLGIILSSIGIIKVNNKNFLKTQKDKEFFEETINEMKQNKIKRKSIILDDKNKLTIEIR